MNPADELVHAIMHLSQLQASVHLTVLYGHVSDYDVDTHRVRCMVPAWADGSGAPSLTNWIPLASPSVGPGSGIQYALTGGASFTNPTDGELVAVLVLDDSSAALLAVGPFWTSKMATPSTQLSAPMQPGEIVTYHASGSYLYFQQNGNVIVNGPTQFLGDVEFSGGKIGFYNSAPVAQPTVQPDMIDATGGVANLTLGPITGTSVSYPADAVILRAWAAQLVKSVNALTDALAASGINLVQT
jgi:predicted NUDIX family NTP pyrophosphohydrolase